MTSDLYNHPFYYDLAFGWDQTEEIKGLEKIWKKHYPREVKTVLEPACGSGRVLVALAQHGYSALGYDINPNMVEFAREKLIKEGVEKKAKAVEGDMVNFTWEGKFDISLNLINSLGYLLEPDLVKEHLASTARCLRENGLYIIQISFRIPQEELPKQQTWVEQKEGVSIETTWQVLKENQEKKLSQHRCIMKVKEKGVEGKLEEEHTMASWTYPSFKKAIQETGFWELLAIYNENFQEVEKGKTIDGKQGNLYLVLGKRWPANLLSSRENISGKK